MHRDRVGVLLKCYCVYMSFNLANRLNNLASATSTLSTNLAENYYTKAETDTEITNLKKQAAGDQERQRRQRSPPCQ